MRCRRHNSVYNARIRNMPSRSPRLFFLWLLPLLITIFAAASSWQGPSTQLAGKIAAATGPGAVFLTLTNRSSLSRGAVDEIHSNLSSELSAVGLRFVGADQAAATINVTLSENPRDYVWTGEIQQGNNESSVVMVTVPKAQMDVSQEQSTAMTVHKTFVWSDENRILDFAFFGGSPQHMMVLEPESVIFLRLDNEQWRKEQSLTIVHARPWPRDLRGRLVPRKDRLFDAYLPGVYCRSNKPDAIDCHPSDDPWPLSSDATPMSGFFSATRNFFTGVLSPGVQKETTTAPFYAAAALPRAKYTLWLFSGVDGKVRMVDGITEQVAARLGWGSDVASIHTGCGAGWQVLATGPTGGRSDKVSAFEVPDREIMAASQPVDFKGTITALWSDSEGNSAIAVAQDPDSGNYEAYRLTVICSQ